MHRYIDSISGRPARLIARCTLLAVLAFVGARINRSASALNRQSEEGLGAIRISSKEPLNGNKYVGPNPPLGYFDSRQVR